MFVTYSIRYKNKHPDLSIPSLVLLLDMNRLNGYQSLSILY